MGAALGYALTLAWPLALAILLALGLGLAAPFLALSLAPGLARRLPRPGAWMEHLKQLLAFPMFATAAWCIACLVNERVALTHASVVAAFQAADVRYLKGDWTNRDPGIGDYLAGFGRTGVPLYVYYPPGAEPRVLPQILTPAMVLQALGSAPVDPRY
ncbi:thioredoxin family protein [uncultured Thiodictyon sp.]|uniref:thioredoxin family protein n=1 Tax=uncultured Thiodictyon sp. TaxID=1846217 RepID=UPI003456F1C6